MQLATIVRNAMLNALETTFGVSPILKIRSGAKPPYITDASTGTVLATMQLPVDWLADAASGQKAKQGTWEDTAADAAGTAGHYEITASDGVTVMERGSILASTDANAATADMQIQNTSIAAGQTVTVATKTYTAGGLL
jgi:hypothetical protein